MKIFLFIFVCIFSLNVNATTTISSISGASVDVDESETTIEVLGGISGVSKCTGGTSTLNSCAITPDRATCNLNTICPTTSLTISITSGASGDMFLIDEDKNVVHDFGTYSSGSSQAYSIDWSEICEEVSDPADASCTTPGTKTLQMGVHNTGDNGLEDGISITFKIVGIPNTTAGNESLNDTDDGVADYHLFPGDEKAYIDYFAENQDFSVADAGEIVGLAGMFVEGTCATPLAVTSASSILHVPLDETTKEISNTVLNAGLENGKTYLFMFGFEDEAGNIGLFKDLSVDCTNDEHTVTPRDVYGLLEENQNCFISTAAFGSPLNAKVKTFKMFRDQILKQFSFGQKFIKFYYQYSPPIANKIKESKTLRAMTRALLWPAWAISAVVLYMGLMPFLFVVTMTLLSFVLLRNKSSKKKLLILFLIFSASTSYAQEDFFSTSESIKATPQESAPKEPPYTGNENDEFSELENSPENTVEAEETYEPEIEKPKRNSFDSAHSENPNKWKPYQRVPEPKRLEELSQQGLMKITKKGGFNYKVKPSEQKHAASFRLGVGSFPNLQNPTSGTTFEQIYSDSKKPILLADYEWQFFKSFGKLGIKVGSGLMVASGNGQLAAPFTPPSTGVPTSDAKEKYNFFMFPNSLAAIYRADFFNKQWIVPFAEAGVDYLAFIEARDAGDEIKFGGSPHFHFAVGGSFLMDTLGKDMMAEIDSQYGVNHLWLTAEFRHLENMGGDFDFSDDIINAGIMAEF